jgi:hypothetical protein
MVTLIFRDLKGLDTQEQKEEGWGKEEKKITSGKSRK